MNENFYTASLSRTQGRNTWAIIFRHPKRTDPTTGKTGLRVRQSLKTDNEQDSAALRDQMSALLASPNLWDIGAREQALAAFDQRIVDMPNGRRYAIAVMVKRPDNDQRANELIRQISRATYDYFLNGGSLSSTSNNSAPANSSTSSAEPASPSNSGNSVIENITLPLPNTAPNALPTAAPSRSTAATCRTRCSSGAALSAPSRRSATSRSSFRRSECPKRCHASSSCGARSARMQRTSARRHTRGGGDRDGS